MDKIALYAICKLGKTSHKSALTLAGFAACSCLTFFSLFNSIFCEPGLCFLLSAACAFAVFAFWSAACAFAVFAFWSASNCALLFIFAALFVATILPTSSNAPLAKLIINSSQLKNFERPERKDAKSIIHLGEEKIIACCAACSAAWVSSAT